MKTSCPQRDPRGSIVAPAMTGLRRSKTFEASRWAGTIVGPKSMEV
ncbi:MAG TPA: hypothetical protein P5217_03765 [Methanoregulaceae archaeon]|nr:hypothetical protein [Methanoregulaceae archaeon]HPD76177.1 hypothetical protein [Methanoregulaceae archaeon]HRY75379.1 hypothetical protein [Methanoregulaceae archaeon]